MNNELRNHKVTLYKGDGFPMVALKTGRNEPCRCGSGKKAKHCCGAGSKYYTTRPKKADIPKPSPDTLPVADLTAE